MAYHHILLSCPINFRKQYCLSDWIEHIYDVLPPEIEIYLVDNTGWPGWHQKLKKDFPDVEFKHIQPKKKEANQDYMYRCWSEIRQKCIDEKKDWLTIECDLFPTCEDIEKLLNWNLPVVAGNYFIYSGNKSKLLWMDFFQSGRYLNSIEHENDESFMICDGSLRQVSQAGFGFAKISHDALKQVPFYRVKEDTAHTDTFFYLECYRQRIPVYIDTSIIVEHQNSDWTKVKDRVAI